MQTTHPVRDKNESEYRTRFSVCDACKRRKRGYKKVSEDTTCETYRLKNKTCTSSLSRKRRRRRLAQTNKYQLAVARKPEKKKSVQGFVTESIQNAEKQSTEHNYTPKGSSQRNVVSASCDPSEKPICIGCVLKVLLSLNFHIVSFNQVSILNLLSVLYISSLV